MLVASQNQVGFPCVQEQLIDSLEILVLGGDTSVCELAPDEDEVELFPKAVDACASSSGFSNAVDKHDAVDQFL